MTEASWFSFFFWFGCVFLGFLFALVDLGMYRIGSHWVCCGVNFSPTELYFCVLLMLN